MNLATIETPCIPSTQRWTLPILIVFVLWVLVLFDPHVWLAAHGGGVILRQIPKYIYLALALVIVLQALGRVWYPPFLLFVASGVMASAFAENMGIAQDLIIKILLLYYVLAVGSLTFITSVEKTTLILHLFLWQFLWWSFHSGGFGGFVWWHPDLGNEDAFGPMMVMGMGYSFYFGMATRERILRLTAFFLSGLCVAGVVSSFARGAVVAAGFVLAYVWWRSPRKSQTFGALVVAVMVFLVAVEVLFPSGQFWQEMSTVSEGFESGTGLDRWILWKTAWREFLENPIFGVGAGNFGPYAFYHLWTDPIFVGYYGQGQLYDRALHSIYFQVLSEFGGVGTIAAIALLVDFWKRNAQLRSAPLVTGWWLATQHRFDLRMLSLALEAAMVGCLATGFFYDQLYVHWFYSLLTLNVLLHMSAKRVVHPQHSHSSP